MTPGESLAGRLAARIRADGPIPYSAFVDAALYDEADGFYARHGSAGRRGDFMTSPEVGPLFGAVVARALDAWWREAGEPARFTVQEAGAGRGTLARAVLAAEPDCASALEYVMVERSGRLRAQHPSHGPLRSAAALDTRGGVVIANELLDNIAFDIVESLDGRWRDVRVGLDASDRFVDVVGEVVDDTSLPPARDGARVPRQLAAKVWLGDALERAQPGRVVVIDYARSTREMGELTQDAWMRTYRGHERGSSPLDAVGAQDVTCDVAIDQLAAVRPPDHDRSQAEFLRAHGLDVLVEEGRRLWSARSGVGDLAALRARSRVRESEALVDPAGLGSFRVLEWVGDPSDQRQHETDTVS